jgi:hypothetical protein
MIIVISSNTIMCVMTIHYIHKIRSSIAEQDHSVNPKAKERYVFTKCQEVSIISFSIGQILPIFPNFPLYGSPLDNGDNFLDRFNWKIASSIFYIFWFHQLHARIMAFHCVDIWSESSKVHFEEVWFFVTLSLLWFIG